MHLWAIYLLLKYYQLTFCHIIHITMYFQLRAFWLSLASGHKYREQASHNSAPNTFFFQLAFVQNFQIGRVSKYQIDWNAG